MKSKKKWIFEIFTPMAIAAVFFIIAIIAASTASGLREPYRAYLSYAENPFEAWQLSAQAGLFSVFDFLAYFWLKITGRTVGAIYILTAFLGAVLALIYFQKSLQKSTTRRATRLSAIFAGVILGLFMVFQQMELNSFENVITGAELDAKSIHTAAVQLISSDPSASEREPLIARNAAEFLQLMQYNTEKYPTYIVKDDLTDEMVKTVNFHVLDEYPERFWCTSELTGGFQILNEYREGEIYLVELEKA